MRTGNPYLGLAVASVPLFIAAALVLLLPRRAGTLSPVRDEQVKLQHEA